eukprot:Rhum_TRINITY_DN24985_c0_g1::Rhum_TRINITY_DN24985_c0_g1_i1::g.180762::m.180762
MVSEGLASLAVVAVVVLDLNRVLARRQLHAIKSDHRAAGLARCRHLRKSPRSLNVGVPNLQSLDHPEPRHKLLQIILRKVAWKVVQVQVPAPSGAPVTLHALTPVHPLLPAEPGCVPAGPALGPLSARCKAALGTLDVALHGHKLVGAGNGRPVDRVDGGGGGAGVLKLRQPPALTVLPQLVADHDAVLGKQCVEFLRRHRRGKVVEVQVSVRQGVLRVGGIGAALLARVGVVLDHQRVVRARQEVPVQMQDGQVCLLDRVELGQRVPRAQLYPLQHAEARQKLLQHVLSEGRRQMVNVDVRAAFAVARCRHLGRAATRHHLLMSTAGQFCPVVNEVQIL